MTGLALLTAVLVLAFVPSCPGDAGATGRRELRAFREPQVWLTLLAGAIGFGGMFAVYSYIAPTVTEVGGLPEGAVPGFLLAFGVGMVVGTWLAGELADWSVFRSLLGSALGLGWCCCSFSALAPSGWWLLPVGFVVTVLGSVLVVNLQLRLMDVAGEAQTIGAALNHASLNIANAAGAVARRRRHRRGLRLPRDGSGGGRARPGGLRGARRGRTARPTAPAHDRAVRADSPFGLGPDVVRALFTGSGAIRSGAAPARIRSRTPVKSVTTSYPPRSPTSRPACPLLTQDVVEHRVRPAVGEHGAEPLDAVLGEAVGLQHVA